MKDTDFTLGLEEESREKFLNDVREIQKRGNPDSSGKGVIYLGHIPQGFFETQVRKFFSQFGRVSRVRLSRSKRTGNIRGYGYVEFASDITAKVAAETMNNYLFFNKLLKCEYVPAERVHAKTFVGSNRIFKRPAGHFLALRRHNHKKSEKQLTANKKRLTNRIKKRAKKLSALGIKHDVSSILSQEVTKQVK